MNIKLFLSLLVFTVLSSSAMAQCNSHHKKSHHKNVKSAYHERNDIIDIASGNDQFSTLTTAVKVAGLVGKKGLDDGSGQPTHWNGCCNATFPS